MAEFQEMVREFQRLCETQRRLHKNTCDKCLIKIATMGAMFQCYRYVLEKPKEAENIIMSWAADHPEPVYPTWSEWLYKQGVLKDQVIPMPTINDNSSCVVAKNVATEKLDQQIPVGIAEKLGIEPKPHV